MYIKCKSLSKNLLISFLCMYIQITIELKKVVYQIKVNKLKIEYIFV